MYMTLWGWRGGLDFTVTGVMCPWTYTCIDGCISQLQFQLKKGWIDEADFVCSQFREEALILYFGPHLEFHSAFINVTLS